MPRAQHDAWIANIERERDSRGSAELHGTKLLRSERGRRMAARIVECGFQHGCLPLNFVAYKQFSIALRLIDTFFDPWSNPVASWVPNHAFELRKALAETLWRVGEEHIRDFASTWKKPTRADWRRIAIGLANDVRKADSAEDSLLEVHASRIYASLRGAVREMPRIYEAETIESFGSRYAGMSLNLPVFVGFMRLADAWCEAITSKSGKVIHDESREFKSAFEEVFRLLGSVGRGPHHLRIGGRVVRFGVTHLQDFTTAVSHSTPGLQAADVLASSIRHVATRVLRVEALDEAERDLAAVALGLQLMHRRAEHLLQLDEYIGASADFDRLFPAVLDAVRARHEKPEALTGGAPALRDKWGEPAPSIAAGDSTGVEDLRSPEFPAEHGFPSVHIGR